MIREKGYILNCIKYKDYDLLCAFVGENSFLNFINRNALKEKSKLNCNAYKLFYVECEFYKANQKYFTIKNINLLRLNEINYSGEDILIFNIISELTYKYLNFNINDYKLFYKNFDNLMIKINNKEKKYQALLNYYFYILKSYGILNNFKDIKELKEYVNNFCEYYKIDSVIKDFIFLENNNIFNLINGNLIDLDLIDFKNILKIFSIFYQLSMDVKLNFYQYLDII